MAGIETPRPIRGTQDIFGPEAEAFAFVVETFERVRKLYRFRRAEMPVFERTEVFSRSLGETTDVVSKEMYSFEDRGGESLTLRPEFTAGIARAYLTGGWQQYAPLKVATHGPLFRYERPQKGRYRQFHQLDAEIIGAAEPQADVELLAMADQLLSELGIADGVTLQLNTLGDADSREGWRAALVSYFRAHRAQLSQDSQDRLNRNPLRILDSKDPRARAGARPRLLPSHRVRVRDREAGRAGNGARRWTLRRSHRGARRPAHAGGRLGRGDRAAGDAGWTTRHPCAPGSGRCGTPQVRK
jgi:histidyl-tRNA synthetase